MNFLNIIIGIGLILMGLYTFSISNWDWISITIAGAQLFVGIYLIWVSFKKPEIINLPIQM